MAAFQTFIDDATLKTKVQELLSLDVFPSVDWAAIITDSNQSATNEIYSALLDRDYAFGDAQGWDRAIEFNTDLALYWALTKGGATGDFEDKFINALDRRAELKTCAVTVGGILVRPGVLTSRGRVSSGQLCQGDNKFSTDMKF